MPATRSLHATSLTARSTAHDNSRPVRVCRTARARSRGRDRRPPLPTDALKQPTSSGVDARTYRTALYLGRSRLSRVDAHRTGRRSTWRTRAPSRLSSGCPWRAIVAACPNGRSLLRMKRQAARAPRRWPYAARRYQSRLARKWIVQNRDFPHRPTPALERFALSHHSAASARPVRDPDRSMHDRRPSAGRDENLLSTFTWGATTRDLPVSIRSS